MTTSGTVTYRTTRDQIVKGALRLVNAYDSENTAGPTANQISLGAEALNLLVKSWEANGLQLWERKWGVIFPRLNQGVYSLGSPGPAGDHACLADPLNKGDFVNTTLASSAASGASSIVVTSTSSGYTTGISVVTITDTYNIAIQLDSGDLQWTTVSGAPSGTTVTLAASLTGAASSGNRVFCYQTKLMRPLRVLDGWIRNTTGGNDIPINLIPRENYNRFGVKTSAGQSVQMYYNPQLNSGQLYLYPVVSSVTQLIYIEFQKPIDDFTASGDDYDMPQEWGAALKFNLALHLAPEYEVSDTKFKQLALLATATFQLINGYDQENTSVFLQPNEVIING